MTSVLRGFELSESDPVEDVLNCLGITGERPKDIAMRMARALSGEIVYGASLTLLPALEQLGFIQTSGDYREGVDAVIVVGGATEEGTANVKSLDIPLIQALKESKATVVGVEPLNSRVSYMRAYRNLGISTVDNVDTWLGQIALIYLLSGGRGNFGVRSTAKALVPDIFPILGAVGERRLGP